jgi:hypothetical protein
MLHDLTEAFGTYKVVVSTYIEILLEILPFKYHRVKFTNGDKLFVLHPSAPQPGKG